MAKHSRRVQTNLTEEQFAKLSRIVEETRKPMSVLIREAIENMYIVPQQRQQRQTALESLLSLNAPVSGWHEMEEEIIQGVIK